MFSWLFKRRDDAGARAAPPAPAGAAPAQPARRAAAKPAPAAKPGPAAKPAPAPQVQTEWASLLLAAQGDDAALLRIARDAPALAHKEAAVQALATEPALREAEREFRSHDRKVHRLAKQRLDAAVAQRESRQAAAALIERTAELLATQPVPMNHVVVLDREWQALPETLLEPGQRDRFAALRAELDTAIRRHGDELQRLQRWTADAQRCLAEWRQGIVAAAQGGTAAELAALNQALAARRAERPDTPVSVPLDDALARAQQAAAQIEPQLAWFDAPEQPWPDPQALADAELGRILAQRHAQWLQARLPVAAPAPPRKPPRTAAMDADAAQRRQEFESRLQAAEAALAEGQLAALQPLLHELDGADMGLPDGLRARHQALRAEAGRLKGWQAWGGSVARDELVAEAEGLARLCAPAAEGEPAKAPGLDLKSHGEAIRKLRQRWKELDRLAAPALGAQWQRFDAALQLAHGPVAAQQAVLKATREANLQAREALLAQLEAQALPEAVAAEDAVAVDWKDVRRALGDFQLAWRKLGPVEHTVPFAARDALQQRHRAAVERLEAPLQDRVNDAAAQREALIAQAEALAAEVGRRPGAPDANRQLRDLQARWQDHARQLPLPRPLEAALWARFRAASDALFAHRDAAAAAREAELAAHITAREALLGRLEALGADTPAADVARTLKEVEREWRQAGALPHGAEALEQRFRAARATAAGRLDAAARQGWQAQCDALAARLALCEEREAGSADGADLEQRWAALAAGAALPEGWAQALSARWSATLAPQPPSAPALDELLLRLEAALDMPVTPERQAERHQLKLRALKDTLEGRPATQPAPATHAECWRSCLRQRGANAGQRQRLQAIAAALRQAVPGTLA